MANPFFEAFKSMPNMGLMPKDLEKKIPPLYAQENKKDPVVYAKFFTPISDWSWYVLGYDPATRECFGLVKGFETELGYFSITEMESMGGVVERDIHWTPTPLSKVRQSLESKGWC